MIAGSMVKKQKKHLDNTQLNNTHQEVGVLLSKSTIMKRLHKSKYRGFSTRCKPLICLKNRKKKSIKARPVLENNYLDYETKI